MKKYLLISALSLGAIFAQLKATTKNNLWLQMKPSTRVLNIWTWEKTANHLYRKLQADETTGDNFNKWLTEGKIFTLRDTNSIKVKRQKQGIAWRFLQFIKRLFSYWP